YWNVQPNSVWLHRNDPEQGRRTMYKTGDLGRWLPDGNIEFLGRKDEQVKIRGYRIEPGEIENILLQIDGVKQAVVIARADKQNNKRLVGYVVREDQFDQHAILQYLQERLPSYMIPSALVQLESIPLTGNGKVNRKELPEADGSFTSSEYVAPRNEAEKTLALIWKDLLSVDQPGIHDNFFELGGHSLLAMRVISAIRKQTGKEIAVREIFAYPTITGLAARIMLKDERDVMPPIERYDRTDLIPLSFEQERLWFIDRLQGTLPYHLPWVVKMEGRLDIAALEQSFKTIVDRHEVLRTVITEQEGMGYQQIKNGDHFNIDHITAENIAARGQSNDSYIQEYIVRAYDLSKDPMLRVSVVKVSPEEHILVVVFHHIAFDGWSISLMVEELVELYNSFSENRSAILKEIPVQYADYAIWQRNYLSGETLERKLGYWKEKLSGVEHLELPVDHPRPVEQSIRGGVAGRTLSKELLYKLQNLSREHGATLFMTLLGVYKILLHRYSGQQDICVGTPIAGRQQQEVEGLIGFFVNTLALRSQLTDGISFDALLEQVKQTTLDAYEHQQIPFEKVVEALGVERNMSRTPVFQVMFALQNMPESEVLELNGLNLIPQAGGDPTAKFELNLTAVQSPQGLHLSLTYLRDLYEEETIERMLDHYTNLLEAVLVQQKSIQHLPMLAGSEIEQLHELGISSVDYPKNKTVIDIFEEHALHTPNAIALVFENEQLSYGELNERANKIAAYLLHKGLQREELVVISVKRSLECIIGILGILKAGGAFVPVDPAYPDDRIAYILADTKARFCLADHSTKQRSAALSSHVEFIDIKNEWDVVLQATSVKTIQPDAKDLVYVIYTSGSTGKPKGVLLEHQALMDHIFGEIESAELKECASFALVATLAADAAHSILFSALVLGSAVHMVSDEVMADGEKMAAYLNNNSIDAVKFVPSLWMTYTEDNYIPLPRKMLMFGGEVLQLNILKILSEAGYTGNLFNHYGPTEAGIAKCIHKLDLSRSYATVPIGSPFSNTQLFVLDPSNQLCPVGVPGELYIGGDGLARGYMNLPEMTNEKFVVHNGQRLYKTGDVVKWSVRGEIEYLGRRDDQVKIRGYRIELGEITAALRSAEGVTNGVVVAKADKQNGKRLVGYVVASDGFNKETILSYLQSKLPEYMMPAALVQLEKIPLTANGKTDTKRLPEPEFSSELSAAYEAPRNEVEEQLSFIWQQLLGIERAGIHDNFFELGGHSLLAMRMISAIRKQTGREIAVREIFSYPTIAGLATRIILKDEGDVMPPITRYDRTNLVPLSFEQERLWFIDKLQGSQQYHIPWVVSMSGRIDIEALEQSFRTIVDRHEVLRTVIIEREGTGYQLVKGPGDFKIDHIAVQDIIAGGQTREAYIEEYIVRAYDLSKDSMLRVSLVKVSEEEHTLVVVFHHIAFDGWSTSVMVEELVELYNSYIENRSAVLKELPVQYADYAIRQRNYLSGETLERKLAYWKQKLGGVEPLSLPIDHARPAEQGIRGAAVGRMLSKELLEKLESLSREQGATLYMTLLSVFKILLRRYSNQHDICVGTPIAGRQQQELEGLIGFFVNTLALRSSINDSETFTFLLEQVKQTTLDAYEHQQIPFEKVVETLGVERDMSRSPVFQVMFMLQNTPESEELKLGELDLRPEGTGDITAKFELTLSAVQSPDGLLLGITYLDELYNKETIERMLGHYENLLTAVLADIARPIAELSMLSAQEIQLLNSFNDTALDYPKDKTIVDLFSEQAQLHTDKLALVFEQSTLTYKELDERSNQLANYLISRNVLPGDMVGICLERSAELIISILAILKAGAAYVPVDPAYPAERINYLLHDSGIKLLLTNSNISLPAVNVEQIIVLNDEAMLIAFEPVSKPQVTIDPSSLAYLMYTSGSTGKPKGVMVDHGNIVSLVKGVKYVDFSAEEVLLATGSPSFDAATFEYWGMLLNGGRLILCSQEDMLNTDTLKQLIVAHEVSIMWFTAGWFNELVETDINLFATLKTVLAGGDRLSVPHINQLKSTYPQLRIINGYGPTENTTFSLTYEIKELIDSRREVPVGRPLENRTAYILDNSGRHCPVGVPGEICVGGAGLSKGYW
ncbi:MAG: amino acid adenylation domain-containing protein, partial [Chitinophagaceae bacterium]